MKGVTGRQCLLAFATLLLLLPHFAHAQVVISEIMYNPQGSDSGREWIELYNAGQSDVTLVGGTVKGSWRVSDGSNHTLTDPAGGTGRGSLKIPAGGYLIIANDPTPFTTGEYAGGSYSVVKSSISLSNAGGTIALIDGTGTTVDTVTYTSAQGGNDDGSSLQRQPSGSWIAALPTPGVANSSTPYVPPADTSSANSTDALSTTQQNSSQTAVQSYVPPPTPSLYADAGFDKTVIVGADVEFDASAYDKKQELLDPTTVRFSWNFGDGESAEGPSVLHHFSYPGRYAVILNIANARNAASDQITVTAEPAALAFSLLQDGGVKINNNAGHDLDLSSWIVRQDSGSFASQFILPQYSKILAGASMNISSHTLSFRASSSTILEYPNGSPAVSIGQVPALQASTFSTTTTYAPPTWAPVPATLPTQADPTEQTVEEKPSDDVQDISSADATTSEATDTTEAMATSSQLAAVAATHTPSYFWWGGILLALLAASGMLVAKRFKSNEWNLIEDTFEQKDD